MPQQIPKNDVENEFPIGCKLHVGNHKTGGMLNPLGRPGEGSQPPTDGRAGVRVNPLAVSRVCQSEKPDSLKRCVREFSAGTWGALLVAVRLQFATSCPQNMVEFAGRKVLNFQLVRKHMAPQWTSLDAIYRTENPRVGGSIPPLATTKSIT